MEYLHGFQTVATEFDIAEDQKDSWDMVQQFMGHPERARLTCFETKICLDFYFP